MSTKNQPQNKFILAKDFKPESVLFDAPKNEPNGNRINARYRYDDGSTGDLLVITPPLFCFGISDPPQKKDPAGNVVPLKDEKKDGTKKHIISMVLWNRDTKKPTPDEKALVTAAESFWKLCQKNVDDPAVKGMMGKLEEEQIPLKNPVYYKRSKDATGALKIDRDSPPTLSPKIIEDKQGKVRTLFTSPMGDVIEDPMTEFYKQFFTGRFAVKFEGIWVGAMPAIQMKVYQVVVLEKKTQSITAIIPMDAPLLKAPEEDEDKLSDTASLNGDVEETIKANTKKAPTPPAPAPAPVAKPTKPTRAIAAKVSK